MNRHRRRWYCCSIGVLCVLVVLSGSSCTAFEKGSAGQIDAKSRAILGQLQESAKNLQTFRVKATREERWLNDEGTDWGSDRETYEIAFERPNRVHLTHVTATFTGSEVENEELGQFVCDGKELYTYFFHDGIPEHYDNEYMVEDAPTAKELARMCFQTDVAALPGVIFLSEMFEEDPYTRVMERLRRAEYIGLERIRDVKCHHLKITVTEYYATTSPDMKLVPMAESYDMKYDLWVSADDIPLPMKVVRELEEDEIEQLSEDELELLGEDLSDTTFVFENWEVNPTLPDDTFVFEPPAGAKKWTPEMRPEIPQPPGAGEQTHAHLGLFPEHGTSSLSTGSSYRASEKRSAGQIDAKSRAILGQLQESIKNLQTFRVKATLEERWWTEEGTVWGLDRETYEIAFERPNRVHVTNANAKFTRSKLVYATRNQRICDGEEYYSYTAVDKSFPDKDFYDAYGIIEAPPIQGIINRCFLKDFATPAKAFLGELFQEDPYTRIPG